MAAAVLLSFSGEEKGIRPPLANLSLPPDLLAVLREYQLLQFHPRVVLTTVRDWVASGGGSSERVLGRLRAVGAGLDPHVLCFGPTPNRGFFHCLARAPAVVPYRIEEERVYVYDPNHPRDQDRFVKFTHREFEYGGFRSREGWGITLTWGKTSGEERSNVLTRAAEILADVSVTFMGHGSVPCCLGAAQRPCRCHQRQRTVPQEKHLRQGG